MKYTAALAFMLVDGLLLISALPQGGYQTQRPSAPYGSPSSTATAAAPQGSCCGGASATPSQSYGQSSELIYAPPGAELQGSAASFGSGAFASNQQQSFGAFGGGGGGSGGNLNVECQRQDVGGGKYKFVCEGANRDAISLRSEHILWLTGPSGQQQVVDIEIPNYKIEELIKAGFKTTPGQGSLINVLLKRPEQSYDAQVDTLNSDVGSPSVKLQYEPVEKTVVHFPNDKPYSPLSGPILPPANGAGGGRPQRQTQKQFSKPYGGQQQVVQVIQRQHAQQ